MANNYERIVRKRGGGFLGKFIVIMGLAAWEFIAFFGSMLICVFLESIFGKDYSWIFIYLTLIPSMLTPIIYLAMPEKIKKQKNPALEASVRQQKKARRKKFFTDLTARIKERKHPIPHFGSMFTRSQIVENLRHERFTSYIDANGNDSLFVKVSESDKWLQILGKYIPIDLVFGYNKKDNVLYTIDGHKIKLPFIAKAAFISDYIESFFAERGMYYKEAPSYTVRDYKTVIKKHGADITTADWGRVRYQWEKSIARGAHPKTGSKSSKFKASDSHGEVNPEVFERVLADSELQTLYHAVLCNNVHLSDITDFAAYKNEFCVCNTVKILQLLKYPKNSGGMEFLFTCLCDPDEAYFSMAADVLSGFPKNTLEKELEERAQLYHESEDALKLAGILFLAKEIGYEIKYVESIKDRINEVPSATLPYTGKVVTGEDGVAAFVAATATGEAYAVPKEFESE